MRLNLPTTLLAAVALGSSLLAQGRPVPFAERFALAEERAAALDELVPGSPEHFYFSTLLAQHEGRFDDAGSLIADWRRQHGNSGAIQQAGRRQLLLAPMPPTERYAALQRELGLRFNQQRQAPGARPDLASVVDPGQLAVQALDARARQLHRNSLDGFQPAAISRLAAAGEIPDNLLWKALDALGDDAVALPPNLPQLILKALAQRDALGFDRLHLAGRLTLAHLEACAQARPNLLGDSTFVGQWLRRLVPSDDADRSDPQVMRAWFDRLEAFVARLPRNQDSLRAHVLGNRLKFELEQGQVDRDRLLAYVSLPRRAIYMQREYMLQAERAQTVVRLDQSYPSSFGAVGDDSQLLRDCLMQVFRADTDYRDFARFLDENWLRPIFAETKILYGDGGEDARWFAMVDDSNWRERLRDRVELLFPAGARSQFDIDEAVALDVELKNIDQLLVKVFEVDTYAYLRSTGRAPDASLDLDGLVPGSEQRIELDASPLRRVARRIELPSIAGRRGVWVVELIGGGTSSRAVVRKGALTAWQRTGAAGHEFHVLDETGAVLRDARVELAGSVFTADAEGVIVVPFSTDPGARQVLLRHGGFAAPYVFSHRAESYQLRAGVHVPREALVSGNRARMVLRPTLLLSGQRLPIGLVEQPRLQVIAVNLDGIQSSQDVELKDLQDGVEIVHEFSVPPRLASLRVQMLGQVPQIGRDEPAQLSSVVASFEVNGIDRTVETHCALLRRDLGGYYLEVLGKDGEPVAGKAVAVALQLREHRDALQVSLATDERGRIGLGSLEQVTRVSVSGVAPGGAGWQPREALVSWPSQHHALVGEEVRLPAPMGTTAADLAGLQLQELRGATPVADRASRVALRDGCLVIDGLAAGDYQLTAGTLAVSNRDVRLQIVDGEVRGRALVGAHRLLSRTERQPLRIVSGEWGDEAVTLRLAGHGPGTRVHVYSSRFLPTFSAWSALAPAWNEPSWGLEMPRWPSDYLIGRRVGDEYRYVLERRDAAKYPGNMLARPGLILNPWAVDEADTGRANDGREGGRFRPGPSAAPARSGEADGAAAGGVGAAGPGVYPNFDFLPEAAGWVTDLRPDAAGVVRVPLGRLGSGQQLHVVVVDVEQVAYQQMLRADSDLPIRTATLAEALDPAVDHLQQRGIELVGPGQDVVIADLRSGQVQTYASLGEVFDLFVTLGGAGDLPTFAFIKDWPSLDATEKRAKYSEFACHELHVFLHEKDPQFFDAVVRPYLANKLDPTFLDHWLLDAELTPYLEPWRFWQLNVVEQVLLARRLPAHRAAVVRLLKEGADRRAQTAAERSQMVRTALLADALDKAPAEITAGRVLRRFRAADEKQYRGPGDAVPNPGGGGGRGGQAGPARPGPGGPATPGPGGPSTGGPAGPATGVRPGAGAEDFYMGAGVDRARESRNSAQRLYAGPDATRRYVEHNYWHLKIEDQDASLIEADRFWADFAALADGQPFASQHLVEAAGNFAEAMLALAFLDLPFAAPEQEPVIESSRWSLRTAGPTLVVREEIAPAERAAAAASMLVSQNLYRLDEPFVVVDGQRRDRFLDGELLVGIAYGCRLVVTNPTSSPRILELLAQVPSGALPVNSGFLTRGASLQLQPYGTATYEYQFYFPRAGEAVLYPARVAEDGEVVAEAVVARTAWPVVTELSEVDEQSWDWVSQNADAEKVLEWLATRDYAQVDLQRIAWRLRDRGFYDQMLAQLRGRHWFDGAVWSFGIHHGDERSVREYLEWRNDFQSGCGPVLDSSLLRIDPVLRRRYEHVEFAPLINARAHPFAGERRILNGALSDQYAQLLAILSHLPKLKADDWLQVTYYLLLQDRVAEALDAFAKVDRDAVATQLQYDYAQAYLAFYTEDLDVARRLAEQYRDHPVARWRDRFRTVLAQLDEAATVVATGEDSAGSKQDPAASAPSLELELEGDSVRLRHANLGEVEFNLYRMDVEFLFSTRPFAAQDQSGFAYVRPNRSQRVALDAASGRTEVAIPADLRDANLMIEVRGGGLLRSELRIASSMAVRWMDTQGQLQVSAKDTGRPLSKVYVKVFAREPGGRVRFHKDGYTDLRGRFDYASLSGSGVMNVESFAVLVLSEERGATIRELAPPAR